MIFNEKSIQNCWTDIIGGTVCIIKEIIRNLDHRNLNHCFRTTCFRKEEQCILSRLLCLTIKSVVSPIV